MSFQTGVAVISIYINSLGEEGVLVLLLLLLFPPNDKEMKFLQIIQSPNKKKKKERKKEKGRCEAYGAQYWLCYLIKPRLSRGFLCTRGSFTFLPLKIRQFGNICKIYCMT